MLKKVLALAMALTLTSATLIGCGKSGGGSAQGKDSDTIKLGAVYPLTGDVAAVGESCKNALQMLEEETNNNGGINGKKIKFSFEDDENKPASAANVIRKLIDKDKVVGIIGSYSSKCSISMGPIATSSKIPMISHGTNPKVTLDGGEYVFTSTFNDTFQGAIVAKVANEDLKAKTAAILYDVGNDYCKGLSEFFKTNFEKAGGKVVASETYNTGDQDFNAQLTKIKGLNPDVILLPDYYSTVALIAKQARSIGVKSTFLGGDGWDSPELFKIGGDSVNGSYFSNFFSMEDTTPAFVKFKESYQKKYNKLPDSPAATAYNAASLMLEAIKKAGSTDGEKIKEALKATDVDGISGHTKYDANRNTIMSGVVMKVEDGKQKFVRKVNP